MSKARLPKLLTSSSPEGEALLSSAQKFLIIIIIMIIILAIILIAITIIIIRLIVFGRDQSHLSGGWKCVIVRVPWWESVSYTMNIIIQNVL